MSWVRLCEHISRCLLSPGNRDSIVFVLHRPDLTIDLRFSKSFLLLSLVLPNSIGIFSQIDAPIVSMRVHCNRFLIRLQADDRAIGRGRRSQGSVTDTVSHLHTNVGDEPDGNCK
jgi:hypothetical protein